MKFYSTSRLTFAISMLLLLESPALLLAGSATWGASPATDDWNTATNWNPQTVPNGSSDVATFATSNQTAVSLSAHTTVDEITFNSGASAFTITVPPITSGSLNLVGAGINNDSSTIQNFVVVPGGRLQFFNNATAGPGRFATFSVGGGAERNAPGGLVRFHDAANAAGALLTLEGGTAPGARGGKMQLNDTADGAGAIVTANGGTSGGKGGLFDLRDKSGAANTEAKLFGNGTLAIDRHAAGFVLVGSIEGDGIILLGGNRLRIYLGATTTFSGTIRDGPNGVGGSLFKMGRGGLTLTGANTYTGGTTINQGFLFANNPTGSATGSGPVENVGRAAALGGSGTIAGPVTMMAGTLAPTTSIATGMPSHLTINNTLTFNPTSSYNVRFDAMAGTSSEVTADGVTISANVTFNLSFSGTPTKGTVLRIIDNVSANPIFGTFSNLPDGSTISFSGGPSFKANYEGGTGNDLTLTVQ